MLIAHEDEEKRSREWRIVTVTTTIIIILIAGFFAVKMFTDNPLLGKWVHQGSDLSFDIQKDSVWITDSEIVPGVTVTYSMEYKLNRDRKSFQLSEKSGEFSKVKEKLGDVVTESVLQEGMQRYDTTYGYSVDGEELTLTDQEYGEQMVFDKQ